LDVRSEKKQNQGLGGGRAGFGGGTGRWLDGALGTISTECFKTMWGDERMVKWSCLRRGILGGSERGCYSLRTLKVTLSDFSKKNKRQGKMFGRDWEELAI